MKKITVQETEGKLPDMVVGNIESLKELFPSDYRGVE